MSTDGADEAIELETPYKVVENLFNKPKNGCFKPKKSSMAEMQKKLSSINYVL